MARISANELLSRLEKGKPLPAILLLGEEPYLRDSCRTLLIEKYVPEAARAWAVSRYSADRGETQAALEQAQTMAMLSPIQVVFLEDAEAIESLGEKSRDEAVERLTAYLEDPAPFTVLVIEATQLDQRMKWGKLLAEKTLVVECGLGENLNERQAAAVALARAMAKEQGVEFERGAADRGFDAAENGNRQAGNVCGGKKADSPGRRQRAGCFGKDDDGLGTGGPAGVAAGEESAGVSGPAAA